MDSMTDKELLYRQRLPLEVKIRMTEARIRSFVNYYGEEGIYISFSGGKDSTVLMDIARRMYPSIKAVYLDTWMEYPQVRRFVYDNYGNIDIIKPSKSMKTIIDEVGWCFPSKDVAQMIEAVRRGQPWAIRKMNGLDKNGEASEFRQQYKKWRPLVDAPFKVSPGCCIEQKEKPIAEYELKTGRHPIVALMAEESERRKSAYLKTGCNLYDVKEVVESETGEVIEIPVSRPLSKPMGFWTEQDVLCYIKENNLPIASVYGVIHRVDELPGQTSMLELMGLSSSCRNCKLCTSGEKRTGCIFCPIACHLDKFAKFKRLRELNKELYDYCMDGLGARTVLEWVDKTYVHSGTVF